MHEKSVFFFFYSFFRNTPKTAETVYFDKKNWVKPWMAKALISEHRKNYIFRDNIIAVLSKCLLVSYSVSMYVTNFCGRTSSKGANNENLGPCIKLNQKCLVKSRGWPHRNVSI